MLAGCPFLPIDAAPLAKVPWLQAPDGEARTLALDSALGEERLDGEVQLLAQSYPALPQILYGSATAQP